MTFSRRVDSSWSVVLVSVMRTAGMMLSSNLSMVDLAVVPDVL